MSQKKEFIIIFIVFFNLILYGCSRDIYVYKTPEKARFVKIQYLNKFIIPIDPTDTTAIKENSFTEIFRVIDIRREKGVYAIVVESDSIRTVYNSNAENSYSFHPTYIVFSLKSKNIKNHEKIKKEGRYKLTLNPCFEPGYIADFAIVSVYIKGMRFEVIKSTLEICTTPNLEGLYYINP